MFQEDLSLFFTDFAQTAVIGGVSVQGIFESEYIEVGGVSTLVPAFTCPTASVANKSEGATVVVDGVNYRLIVKEQDGTGLSRLLLQRL